MQKNTPTQKITDLQEFKRQLEQMRSEPFLSWISSGYKALDDLTGGLVKGGLTLIASRPAMGKTSLVLNMVSRLAKQEGGNILIFTPRVSEREVTARFLEIGMNLSAGQIFDGSLPAREVAYRWMELLQSRKSNVKFETTTYCELDDLLYRCYRDPDLQLVVVDNPECIYAPYDTRAEDEKGRATYEPRDKVLKALRNMAKALDVPVVCTANLHRSLERRKDKRPRLTDLKKIGVPEELVDQIIFLYRDAYYNWESDNNAECIVAKSSCGRTGTVTLQWHYETARFDEMENK